MIYPHFSSVSISKKRRNRPRRKNDSVATKRKISPVDGSDDNCLQDSPRGEKLRKSCHSEILAEECELQFVSQS